DADHDVGTVALAPLRVAEMGEEAAIRGLADRARVEEDQVGLVLARRLGVAERLEHALHALGVVLVHLAPERGDVVARDRVPRVPGAVARTTGGAPAPPASRTGRCCRRPAGRGTRMIGSSSALPSSRISRGLASGPRRRWSGAGASWHGSSGRNAIPGLPPEL